MILLSEGRRFFRRYRILAFSAVLIIAVGLACSSLSLNILLVLANREPAGLREGTFATVAEGSRTGALRPISWETVRQLAADIGPAWVGAYAIAVPATLSLHGRERTIQVAAVSPDFFDNIAGIDLGSGLSSAPDSRSGLNVIVLSARLAGSLFGSPDAGLGQSVNVGGVSLRINGIASHQFSGLFVQAADAWIPPNCVTPVYFPGPGGGVDEAGHEIWRKAPVFYAVLRASRSEPDAFAKRVGRVLSGDQHFENRLVASPGLVADPVREKSLRRWASIALFLALCLTTACGFSFGGLLLARTPGQIDEVKLRRMLGAGGVRLLADLTAGPFSAVLAGFALSLSLSSAVLMTMRQRAGWFVFSARISWEHVLLSCVSQLPVVLAIAAVMALVPAARLFHDSGAPRLSPAITATGRARAIMQLIVTAQIACGTCACVVAAILAMSAVRGWNEPLGFQAMRRTVLKVRFRLSGRVSVSVFRTTWHGSFPMAVAADQVLSRLSALPGVSRAGIAAEAPLEPAVQSLLLHRTDRAVADRNVACNGVTPSYFSILGAAFVAGGNFESSSMTGYADEAILNRTLANQLWPDGSAVGRTLRLDDPESGLRVSVRVVGVVADQRLSGPDSAASPTVFLPLRGNIFIFAMPLYVLVDGLEPAPVLEATVNQALGSTMPELKVDSSYGLAERLRDMREPELRRVTAAVCGALAIVVVAFAGLYSSLVYSGYTRRREFAIRISCGARPRDIFLIVVRQAVVSGAGAALLSALCWGGLRRLVSSSLAGDAPWSAGAAVGAILACLLATALTSLVPAARAARLPLAEALRD